MYKSRRESVSPISLYCAPDTMRRCKHHDLVEVSDSEQLCLVDPHRLQRIVESLPDPDRQQPLVVACIGSTEKKFALRQLFPANDPKVGDGRAGLCKAYGDALTANSANPIMYWDIEPGHRPPPQDTRAHCHQFQAFRMPSNNAAEEVSAVLVQRLLLPFADVVCIFAEDFGGLSKVTSHLQLWTSLGTAASTWSLGARLVVVVPHDTSGITELEEAEFLENTRALGITKAFRSLRVQRVSTKPLRNARYLLLRESVLEFELESSRADRDVRLCMYTATHLASLFSQCLAHTAKMSGEPFNHLMATRHGIPELPHFADCLSALLRASTRESVPHSTIASILATSLLMQAYPPSSHSQLGHQQRGKQLAIARHRFRAA